MTTTNSTGEKHSGTTTHRPTPSTPNGIDVDVEYLAERLGIDLPRDVQRLGVDAAGEAHYYSPREQWVWVVDADDYTVTHEADLAEKRVHEWLAHVRGERGSWHACNYDPDLGTALANALQRGQEADR